MAETEPEGGEYVCDACGESFESRSALERHLREKGLVD